MPPPQRSLPAAAESARRVDRVRKTPPAAASASVHGCRRSRVLWIEDGPEAIAPLAHLLVTEGFDVEFATSAADGLRLSLSADHDVILLDLKLPDASGIDVLKTIRSSGLETPVIVVTGYGTIDSALEAGRAGAAGFKSKPLRALDLLETIRSVIRTLKRDEPSRLFRESHGEGLAPSIRRIADDLSEVTCWVESGNISAWLEIRHSIRHNLAHAAADPYLTLVEFSGVADAFRLISREPQPWPRLMLEHIVGLLQAGPGPHWRSVNETVQRLVVRMGAAGKTCLHLSEAAVANELGVDANVLAMLLRRDLGLSILQLRRVVLMRRAIQMLAVTDEQVAQIGYAIGFEHPSAFNHSFASLFGVPPRTFRRLSRGPRGKHL